MHGERHHRTRFRDRRAVGTVRFAATLVVTFCAWSAHRHIAERKIRMAAIGDTASAWAPRVRSILRIAAGLFLLQHGTAKILGFPPTEMSGISIGTMPGAAGVIELV